MHPAPALHGGGPRLHESHLGLESAHERKVLLHLRGQHQVDHDLADDIDRVGRCICQEVAGVLHIRPGGCRGGCRCLRMRLGGCRCSAHAAGRLQGRLQGGCRGGCREVAGEVAGVLRMRLGGCRGSCR
eukprot:360047-Chlamydomonas_euryale.AAC.1